MEADDIPSIEQSKLSPTELPFTEEDFDPQLEQAFELMPDLLGAEGAEIRYAINGLLSLTPDGSPDPRRDPGGAGSLVGRRGLDQGGSGRRPGGGRVDDPRPQRDRRLPLRHRPLLPAPARREHTRPRTTEAFNKTYGIVHPAEQYLSDRPQRLAPMHAAQQKLGAVFFEAAGWERPLWYESNAALLEEYGDRVMPREHEWDSRWWSPIINAEHLRMRDAAGIVDLSAFAVFDVVGPGALDVVQRSCVAQCDVAVGKVIYTPMLDAKGGFVSDLTVMRLGRRPLPRGHRRRPRHGRPKRFADLPPENGPTTVTDLTRRTRRSGCGVRAPATSCPRSPPTTSATRPSGSAPAARSSRSTR